MFLVDEVLSGDNHIYKIDDEHPLTPELASEIEGRIRKMRNYIYEWICIVLQERNKNAETTYANFMQFSRLREPGAMNYFEVEIQVTHGADEQQREQNRTLYVANLKTQELIQLFEEVCLQNKLPDFSGWEDITESFSTHAENHKEAQKMRSDYLHGDIKGENGKFLHYESEKNLEEVSYRYDHPFLTDTFWEYKRFDKIKALYEESPGNPWLQKRMGDIEFYGYLGAPDYKKAFEYYSLAAKCGHLGAKFQLGQMYKQGLFVKRNPAKYEKLTKQIFKTVEKICPKLFFLFNYAILELSYIEQEKGNPEKSLEYALLAKAALTDVLSCDDVRANETDGELIRHLRSLTGIDKSDLDLLDLFVLLSSPCTVGLTIQNRDLFIKSYYEKNRLIVKFNGKHYNGVSEFMGYARLSGKRLTTYYGKTDYMEVIK